MKTGMDAMQFSCLTADVGGTNVRFGVVNKGPDSNGRPLISEQMIYPCASFDSIDVAVETYRKHIDKPLPEVACVAVAGPVKNNHVRMTNRDWLISGSELTDRFGFQEVLLLNDAEAIAYATRVIAPSEVRTIKPGLTVDDAPAAVITAGTGVGVSSIVPIKGDWYPLASEAGHITLAPRTPKELAVFDFIKSVSGSISAELLLAGEGIRRIYHALAAVSGVMISQATPKEIVQRAVVKADSVSVEALEMYCNLLGAFAGDIALTFGARGGVYFAGNVMREIEPILSRSEEFRESFGNKRSMAHYLADIPVNLITLDEPGMVGASAWFEHSLAARAHSAR